MHFVDLVVFQRTVNSEIRNSQGKEILMECIFLLNREFKTLLSMAFQLLIAFFFFFVIPEHMLCTSTIREAIW